MMVSSFFPNIGGVQRSVLSLSHDLIHAGVNVVVLTRRLPNTSRFELVDGVPVHRLGLARPDKIGAASFGLHALGVIASRHRSIAVIHVQNIDTPLLVGIAARVFFQKQIVATVHGEAKISFKETTPLGRLRLRLMRRHVQDLVALTEAMEEKLRSIEIPQSRVHRIPNGVDVGFFRPPTALERKNSRRALALNSADVAAVFVGRLVSLKNVDLLIDSWRHISDRRYKLLVIGDGPERKRLEMHASGLKGTTVFFFGGTDDVRTFLWASDYFLLLSEREGLSMALLEAMASGVVPVVGDLPGNSALVQDGVNGFLIRSGSTSDVNRQLHSALTCTEAIRQKLSQNARQTVVAECSLDAVAAAHSRLYCSLEGTQV